MKAPYGLSEELSEIYQDAVPNLPFAQGTHGGMIPFAHCNWKNR